MPEIQEILSRLASDGLQHREMQDTIRAEDIDAEGGTVKVAFSSEAPVLRWFGFEVLDHDAESVDMGRMDDGAAVLINHDTADHAGVVDSASIDSDRRGRAVVRFSKSALGQDTRQDVEDRIRRHISVGYQIDQLERVEEGEGDEPDTFRARWTPHEISFVSIPADMSVGVGRSLDQPETIKEAPEMPEELTVQTPSEAPAIDEASIQAEDRNRVREILAIGKAHNLSDEAITAASEGTGLRDFQASVLDILKKRAKEQPAPQTEDPRIGMSEEEVKRFSFIELIRTQDPQDSYQNDWYREISTEATRKSPSGAQQGMRIPYDVLAAPDPRFAQRDVLASTSGGNLIATDYMAGSFIELLRNQLILPQLGLRSMTGLVGDVDIPVQLTGSTSYWLGEDDSITESQPTFGSRKLTPHTNGVLTEVSRRMTVQASPDIESLMREDMAKVAAVAIDVAGLQGAGTAGQPLGILSASSINTTTISATPTWANMLSFMKENAEDNTLTDSSVYVTTPAVRATLMAKDKSTSTAQFVWADGQIAGFRAVSTNQSAANTIIFGDWSQGIQASWGGIDVLVDPYSSSATGRIRLTIFQDIDYLWRYGQAFCYATNVTGT